MTKKEIKPNCQYVHKHREILHITPQPNTMQFNSISDLYSKLSLKEVKRALQQTESKAKNANDKLMSLVATRYPDLLQVADMVDDMAESQTESMENIVSIQNACSHIPSFNINETREIIKKRRRKKLLVKQNQIKSAQIIQQMFRIYIAKKTLHQAKINKLKLIELEKKQNEASSTLSKTWKMYKYKKKKKLESIRKEKTKLIQSLLNHWVNEESWTYDDDAWLCQRPISTKEIEDGVQVHFPSCASARLFVALHTMVTTSIGNDAIDLMLYFNQIIEKTTSSLARYQLLFDMRFAGMDAKHTRQIVDLLDPIDHTLMDGLVNKAVKNALKKSKRLLLLGPNNNNNDKNNILNHDKSMYDDDDNNNGSRGRTLSTGELNNEEVDQLTRAIPCPRFPIAALRQLPLSQRKKKSGSLSTPTSLIQQARRKTSDNNRASNEKNASGGWWW